MSRIALDVRPGRRGIYHAATLSATLVRVAAGDQSNIQASGRSMNSAELRGSQKETCRTTARLGDEVDFQLSIEVV